MCVCVVLQYPISFALNLAIPTDKVIGAKQVYCASATSPAEAADCAAGTKDSGSKSDDSDEDTLKVSQQHTQSDKFVVIDEVTIIFFCFMMNSNILSAILALLGYPGTIQNTIFMFAQKLT